MVENTCNGEYLFLIVLFLLRVQDLFYISFTSLLPYFIFKVHLSRI